MSKLEFLDDKWESGGWFLRRDVSGTSPHMWGGEAPIGGGCPNCRLPLTQFLRIDVEDKRLGGLELPCRNIPLLNCARCKAFYGDVSYRILGPDEVKVLSVQAGDDEHLAELWETEFGTDVLPEIHCNLVPLTGEVRKIIEEANAGQEPSLDQKAKVATSTGHLGGVHGDYPFFEPVNQIFGNAFLPCGFVRRLCPECLSVGRESTMTFLACITNHWKDDVKIIYDDVYLIYSICRNCCTIKAWHAAT